MLAQVTKFFSLSKIFSGDIAFFLVLFILFFAYAMYFGRGMIVAFIISYYPASFLYLNFPFLVKFTVLHGDKLILLNKIGIFLLFLVPLTIIVDRYIFSASEYSGSLGMLKTVGLTLSAMVLVILFSYSTLNFDLFHNFSPQIDKIFMFKDAVFYWSLAPIVLLALF